MQATNERTGRAGSAQSCDVAGSMERMAGICDSLLFCRSCRSFRPLPAEAVEVVEARSSHWHAVLGRARAAGA